MASRDSIPKGSGRKSHPPLGPDALLNRILGYRAWELRSFTRLFSDWVDTLDTQSGNSSINPL